MELKDINQLISTDVVNSIIKYLVHSCHGTGSRISLDRKYKVLGEPGEGGGDEAPDEQTLLEPGSTDGHHSRRNTRTSSSTQHGWGI